MMTVKELASELKRITPEHGDTEIVFDGGAKGLLYIKGFYWEDSSNLIYLTDANFHR